MENPPRTNQTVLHQASPFAVVGAFALVGVAIFFGIFGPQISNRGNLVIESTLGQVLQNSVDYYQRERFQFQFGLVKAAPERSSILGDLDRRFKGEARYLDLSSLGLEPVGVDSGPLGEGGEARYAVIHRTRPAADGSSKCVAVIYVQDNQRRIAHDEFGVPAVMRTDEIYRFQISGTSSQPSWSATWYEGPVLHVVIAESEDVLDQILQVTSPDVDEGLATPPVA